MQDAAYHRRMTEPAKPVSIQAATVILAREGPGGVPEYLLVQRGEQLAFAGGALVFAVHPRLKVRQRGRSQTLRR